MSDIYDDTPPESERSPRWRRSSPSARPGVPAPRASGSQPRIIQIGRTTPQLHTLAPTSPPASPPANAAAPTADAQEAVLAESSVALADPAPEAAPAPFGIEGAPVAPDSQDSAEDDADVVTVSPDPVVDPGPPRPPVPLETDRRPRTWLWLIVGLVAVVGLLSLLVLPQLGRPTAEGDSGSGFAAGTGAQADATTAPQPTTTAPPTTTPKPPAPVVHRVPTTDPVVFVTIDDGWTLTPDVYDQLVTGKLPASLFPITNVLDKHQDQWKPLSLQAPVSNHTASHPRLDKMPLAAQQAEICSASERIMAVTGIYPTLLRPPYGGMNAETQAAAGACGISYIAGWSVEVREGKFHWKDHPQGLVPGDIILFHFRPELNSDLALALAAIQAAGLRPVKLTDYLNEQKMAEMAAAAAAAAATSTTTTAPAGPTTKAAPSTTKGPTTTAAPTASKP